MSRSRLGLEAERLGSRLGLGHEGLVSIPVIETLNDITDSVYSMITTYPLLKLNWLLLVWRNSVNFCFKQYSNNFE